jgi:RNA polymerase sigma factor (sigma-70 family)
MLMNDSPVNLVERWRQGDQAAAQALFELYVARLVAVVGDRLSRRFVRHVDPDDVVQSAFRSFFVGARDGRFDFERDGDLWRLLVAVALNKLRMSVRRYSTQKRSADREESVPSLDALCTEHLEVFAREPTPVEAVALADEVETLMGRLSDRERQILEMRLQGFNLEEIALETGRSERTVRRVIDKVREFLEQALPPLDG